MATNTEGGLPSLLVQAARTAAEADGLAAPSAGESSGTSDANAAAAALTSIGEDVSKKEDANAEALKRARAAIAAAQRPKTGSAPTAGSAAHMLAASATASVAAAPAPRKAPAPAPQPSLVSSQPSSAGGSKKKGPPLRRGKWTPEEEAYAARLIQEFKAGLLPLTDGTTLRTFLSKLLNCDPMRISKKFVGGNCIGKQVFRRRSADINRLTAEQIQQSRAELSELERRFLERVAQTNRVKSSAVANAAGGTAIPGASVASAKLKEEGDSTPSSPPWLQPPLGYKHGQGAAMAAAANSRAAAAGRALLQGLSGGSGGSKSEWGRKLSNPALASSGSAGLLAMAELQRRNSQQNLLQSLANRSSASNLLAAAASAGGSSLSGSAMAQIARNASAARLASLTAAGNSMNNLMLKTGLSRDQLNQLAREQGLSSANSLSNMMERQSSFDALMSLDFQSLQSIDNLANLIQTGSGLPGQVPESGMKNWSAESNGSSGNLANLANARRLASVGRMESLLRSLSSNNVNNANGASNPPGGASNSNFNNILQSMQSNLNTLGTSGSNSSLFGAGGNAASAVSLANMLRADSSTGLSALRFQDGLNQRNTSVDDFLSLVASGDIPHQDPTLLNVPMAQQQTGGQGQGQSGAQAAAAQYLLAQASSSGNSALVNAIRAGSFGNLANNSSSNLTSAAAALAAQQQARAEQRSRITASSSAGTSKRKLDADSADSQGPSKR